jgi:hypothetical protein
MRRHLEARISEQPAPPGRGVGGEHLVDAELGPMGIAGDVDQEVAEEAVHQPRRNRRVARGELAEGDLELVEAVVARLVDARGLAGGADEEPREQIGERRMVVPVADEAGQQIRPAQERAVGGGRPAEHEVIAAPCRCGGHQ